MPGICAAIQTMRQRLRAALINDCVCVGDNCSMEIMMDCNGASDGDPFISTCARTALRMNCGWYPGSAP